jgi:hypothetical protein
MQRLVAASPFSLRARALNQRHSKIDNEDDWGTESSLGNEEIVRTRAIHSHPSRKKNSQIGQFGRSDPAGRSYRQPKEILGAPLCGESLF